MARKLYRDQEPEPSSNGSCLRGEYRGAARCTGQRLARPTGTAGAFPGWPRAPEQLRAPISSIMQEELPSGSPYPSRARCPDPPLHSLPPSCACRRRPGRCHPGAASALTRRQRLPPAVSALFLQLLARQGVRLLLPLGHHLGEHPGVSYGGNARSRGGCRELLCQCWEPRAKYSSPGAFI